MNKSAYHHQVLVVNNTRLCSDHYLLILEGETLAKRSLPGQFVNLQIKGREELLLRRPFSVAMTNPEQSLFEIVYRVVGKGTRAMVDLGPGDRVDLLGPLGTGFHLPERAMNCLLIGGGCGVAPLWGLAADLFRANQKVTALLGFRSSDKVFGEDVFRKYCAKTTVTTDDGSYGLKGFVSDHLKPILKQEVDKAYICGPVPMLQAVIPMVLERSIAGEVSLEERMGCGYGVCLSCVAAIMKNGAIEKQRVCTDGPVFNLEEVVLDETRP